MIPAFTRCKQTVHMSICIFLLFGHVSKKKSGSLYQLMVLTVGTDCSGMEAPIQALKNLGVKFRHRFSSEIDASCMEMIRANAPPDILYDGDIRNRDNTETPAVDLYVCGFPCQPFSNVGSKRVLRTREGQSSLDVSTTFELSVQLFSSWRT